MIVKMIPQLLVGMLFSLAVSATPIGFITYDVSIPNSTASFNITNQTGVNSEPSPGTDWPVTTQLILSNLNLIVHFTDSTTQTYGSSYFTLSLDGFSFDGGDIPIGQATPVLPVDAVLTGTLSPTTITLNDGSTQTLSSSFSAEFIPNPSGFQDGDFALINGIIPRDGGQVPEPTSWMLIMLGGFGLMRYQRKNKQIMLRTASAAKVLTTLLIFFGLISPNALAVVATAKVQLNVATTPSTGVAGVSNVNLTGTGFSGAIAGAITPANVTVTLMNSSCTGPVAATTTASGFTKLPGSTRRIQFQIPAILEQDDYYVAISDTVDNFSSNNCSKVNVTRTNKTLAACLPTSSLAVNTGSTGLPGSQQVMAYVPNGAWAKFGLGVQAVQIEPVVGVPVTIPTLSTVNSCSSNPATGQTVCTANTDEVYLITGTTLNTTLHSASNSVASFSGGSCQNCGVAINALTNQAVIAMGYSPSPSNSGLQILNLNTNTFLPPFPSTNIISEDISIDPTRGLILSPGESNSYTLYQATAAGTLTEFTNNIGTPGELDSAAEDCSTGIALSSVEFTGDLVITDLTQAAFTAGVGGLPGSWIAPLQVQHFPEFEFFSAGTNGISVAPGSAHLGVVQGEFGGNTFAAIQLPSTSGSGTPGVVDYAAAELPVQPDGLTFQAGLDPHTITAYTSPNDGRAYAVIANGTPTYLAVVDLAKLLAAPRTGSHTVDPAYNLITNGVVRYIALVSLP